MTSIENKRNNIESDAKAVVVLRILNGAMRGAQFELTCGHTLFIAGSATAFGDEDRLPDFPDSAIFVPLDQGACNFEVVVTEEGDVINATLRELDQTEVREHACPLNSVITLGTLEFSVKPLTGSWTTAVLNHPAPALLVINKAPMPQARRSMSMLRGVLIAALLLAILAVTLATAYWIHGSAQRVQTRLSDLLLGSVGEYQVVKGDDEVFYIFADTLRDTSWARQALVRSDFNSPTKVLYARAEKTRIEKWLDNDLSLRAYHILRLDDPTSPTLFISTERGPHDQQARDRAAQALAALLPYAKKVQIVPLDDATVARNAQHGLDRLGITYKRIDKATSVTFEVQGILDDSELQKLRPYIDAFYQRWGNRYVHFSVDLKDDWLKGKSFGYGADSYVKLNNSHWYFSPTIN